MADLFSMEQGARQASQIQGEATGDIEAGSVQDQIAELDAEKASDADFDAHVQNLSNPHQVSKEQVSGLAVGSSPTFASVHVTAAISQAGQLATKAFVEGIATGVVSLQTAVIDFTNTPPGVWSDGDRYLVESAPVGAWAAQANKLAVGSGGGTTWTFSAPVLGWLIPITSTGENYLYDGSDWVPQSPLPNHDDTLSISGDGPQYVHLNSAQKTGLTGGAATTLHKHTQATSHESPDTDAAPTSLHHTLGTGANQAAAGNRGVTNGDAHDHAGGDGGQIAHGSLSAIGTNTHAQIDSAISASASHISDTANPHSTTAAQVGAPSLANLASNTTGLGAALVGYDPAGTVQSVLASTTSTANAAIPKATGTSANDVLVFSGASTPGVVNLTAQTVLGRRDGGAVAVPIGTSNSTDLIDRAGGDARYSRTATPTVVSSGPYTFVAGTRPCFQGNITWTLPSASSAIEMPFYVDSGTLTMDLAGGDLVRPDMSAANPRFVAGDGGTIATTGDGTWRII